MVVWRWRLGVERGRSFFGGAGVCASAGRGVKIVGVKALRPTEGVWGVLRSVWGGNGQRVGWELGAGGVLAGERLM
eukprot:ctg_1542.g498